MYLTKPHDEFANNAYLYESEFINYCKQLINKAGESIKNACAGAIDGYLSNTNYNSDNKK